MKKERDNEWEIVDNNLKAGRKWFSEFVINNDEYFILNIDDERHVICKPELLKDFFERETKEKK